MVFIALVAFVNGQTSTTTPGTTAHSGCMHSGRCNEVPPLIMSTWPSIEECSNNCYIDPQCKYFSYDLEGGTETCETYASCASYDNVTYASWRSGPSGCIPTGGPGSHSTGPPMMKK